MTDIQREVVSDGLHRIPLARLVGRALRRQCPVCGESNVWTSWMSIKESCPNCGYVFARESGYFLGAILLNVIFSELAVMVLMIALLIGTDWVWWKIELLILPLAVIVPVVLIPFFRGIWMTLDLTAHPVKEQDLAKFAQLHSQASQR